MSLFLFYFIVVWMTGKFWQLAHLHPAPQFKPDLKHEHLLVLATAFLTPIYKEIHTLTGLKFGGSSQSSIVNHFVSELTSKRWYMLLHGCCLSVIPSVSGACRLRASHEEASSSSNSIFSWTVDLMPSSHCLHWEMGFGQSYLNIDVS